MVCSSPISGAMLSLHMRVGHFGYVLNFSFFFKVLLVSVFSFLFLLLPHNIDLKYIQIKHNWAIIVATKNLYIKAIGCIYNCSNMLHATYAMNVELFPGKRRMLFNSIVTMVKFCYLKQKINEDQQQPL